MALLKSLKKQFQILSPPMILELEFCDFRILFLIDVSIKRSYKVLNLQLVCKLSKFLDQNWVKNVKKKSKKWSNSKTKSKLQILSECLLETPMRNGMRESLISSSKIVEEDKKITPKSPFSMNDSYPMHFFEKSATSRNKYFLRVTHHFKVGEKSVH